jgi:hypothetical protein
MMDHQRESEQSDEKWGRLLSAMESTPEAGRLRFKGGVYRISELRAVAFRGVCDRGDTTEAHGDFDIPGDDLELSIQRYLTDGVQWIWATHAPDPGPRQMLTPGKCILCKVAINVGSYCEPCREEHWEECRALDPEFDQMTVVGPEFDQMTQDAEPEE